MAVSEATAIQNLMGLGMPAALAEQIADLSTGGGVIANDTYLQWRNAANSANLDILKVTSGDLTILNSSLGTILSLGGNTYFELTSAGDFSQDTTRGGNLLLQRAGTAVAQSVAPGLTAVGTDLATALQLDSVVNVVSTGASGTGVKLWDCPIGGTIIVQNSAAANDIEVYPPNAGATINAAGFGASITLAAATDQIGIFTRILTNTWIGLVGVGPLT